MTAVLFETPGLMDVRSMTIIGAHAKPNSTNPIGYFGSGLKYAISIVVRLGGTITIWIGRDRFEFAKKASTFRGSPLETITMRVFKHGNKRANTYELPYTTAYGKNWKPWMAFRELESNTRDEGGKTSILSDGWDRNGAVLVNLLEDCKTMIVVENCPDFAKAAEEINSIFLPRARRSGVLLEAFDGKSKHIYYRTMRALDINAPTVFTYNVLEALELTENRSIVYNFQLVDVVARWVLTEATEAQVEAVLTAEEDYWEHGLAFPGRIPPSEAFRAVMARRPKGIARSTWGYYSPYAGASRRGPPPGPWRLSEAHPRPWRVDGLEVKDADEEPVFAAPDGYYDDWERTAEAIVARVNVGLGIAPRTGNSPATINADTPDSLLALTAR